MKIFAFAGSLRTQSWNKKLLHVAAALLKERGAEVDVLDLKTSGIPLFDDDVLQAGIPPPVADFKQRILQANAVLISSPEYNYSVPGVLKNAIDWASRPPPTNPFRGKLVAHMGCTPGGMGTIQAHQQLHHILSVGVGAQVLPGMGFTLSKVDQAFDESGALKDETHKKQLTQFVDRFLEAARSGK